MTYASYETSQAEGEPLELYEITQGISTYRYCSSEDDYDLSGIVYYATPISRGPITYTGEARQSGITVQLPASETFAQQYIDIVPTQAANFTIKRIHRPDGATPESILAFKGRIEAVSFTDDGNMASLAVVPIGTSGKHSMPRYTYQGLCNHFLYDDRCKVVQGSFQYTGTVSSVVGSQLTVSGLNAAKGANWAEGGWVQYGGSEFRLVLSQSADVLNLLLPFDTNLAGLTVDVYAGCDHTISTCGNKFSNVINYGGSAYVPLKNIFSSGL